MLRYKKLCGYRIKEKELIKYEKERIPSSYYQWRNNIKAKYNDYERCQLEAFIGYLELGIRENSVFDKLNSIVFSSIFATVYGILMSDFIKALSKYKDIIVVSIVAIVMGIAIVFVVVMFIGNMYIPLSNNDLEKNLYKDYQDIIKQIVDEKNN